MNNAIQNIIAASKAHPWLLVLIALAMVANWADLNWPGYHFSYLSKGMIGFAVMYAANATAVPIPPKPPTPPAP
jgi:hypothetical protein